MSVYAVTIILLALLGLTFGSFTNAAVWRIHERKARSLLNDRSECVHCHHKLAWYDLIPVFSWLSLRGKCRYCGKKIEDTPLPELGVAVYFVVSFLFWPHALTSAPAIIDFIFWLVYGVLLTILFIYDLRYMLLPNKIVFTLIGLAILQLLVSMIVAPTDAFRLLIDALLGVVSIAGIYLALYVISRGRWVGFGDVKLSVFIGMVLADWKLGIFTFLVANIIGCLVILPGLFTHRLNRSSRVPFGPFLITALIVSMLFGERIVGWYLSSLYL